MTGVLLIFGACILWALDTLFRYPLLFGGVSPWSIVWLEHLILVLFMLYWLVPMWRRHQFGRSTVFAFIVIGALGSALGTVAFTKAFSLINPSIVILIQKLQPVVAVSLAAILLREHIDRRFIAWLGICLFGSLLIAWQDLRPAFNTQAWGGRETKDLLLGYGCTLFAVVAWGCATVFGKQLSNRGFSTAELMAGRFLIGFAVLTPFMFAFASPAQVATVAVGKTILIMVLLSGLGGMGLYYLGMKRLPARTCAVAEMFFPVAAVTINWLAPSIDATLTPLQLMGAAVLLLGSTMIALTQMDDSAGKLTGDDAGKSIAARPAT